MTNEANNLFEGADDNVLPPEEDNASENYLETLVGEGKKFKSPEDLARGKAESDRFITKLQQELKEVREDLKERLAVEELSKKIDSLTASASNQHNQRADERDGESDIKSMTPEDIQSYVQESIRKQDEVKSQSQNITTVRAQLHKMWGDNYVEKMQAKANSLGLGKDFATGFAATHPQAFIAMMLDKDVGSPVTSAPPPSSARSTSFNTKVGKTYKDFQKMRKDNPTQYHSTQVQMEMHRLATEMGEDFYN